MPKHLIFAAVLVLLAGAMTAAQPATNAILARSSGSVIFAAVLSFAVGTLALLAVLAVTQPPVSLAPLREVPWYAWVGGFYGAFFVAVGAYAAPRLGIASLVTIAVAGQMIAAMLLDHYGAFGLDRAPISFGRIAGMLLIIGGVVLVRRF
jgi:transporter family-2 protein